jgi:hypothetical protein
MNSRESKNKPATGVLKILSIKYKLSETEKKRKKIIKHINNTEQPHAIKNHKPEYKITPLNTSVIHNTKSKYM